MTCWRGDRAEVRAMQGRQDNKEKSGKVGKTIRERVSATVGPGLNNVLGQPGHRD